MRSIRESRVQRNLKTAYVNVDLEGSEVLNIPRTHKKQTKNLKFEPVATSTIMRQPNMQTPIEILC